MATGPEHYQEAERLLAATDDWDSTDPKHQPIVAELIAEAQVHATLALAAATALSHGLDASSRHAWTEAAS